MSHGRRRSSRSSLSTSRPRTRRSTRQLGLGRLRGFRPRVQRHALALCIRGRMGALATQVLVRTTTPTPRRSASAHSTERPANSLRSVVEKDRRIVNVRLHVPRHDGVCELQNPPGFAAVCGRFGPFQPRKPLSQWQPPPRHPPYSDTIERGGGFCLFAWVPSLKCGATQEREASGRFQGGGVQDFCGNHAPCQPLERLCSKRWSSSSGINCLCA